MANTINKSVKLTVSVAYTGVKAALDKIRSMFDQLGKFIMKIGATIAATSAGMLFGIWKSVLSASNLEEVTSKFKIVFKGMDDEQNKFYTDTLKWVNDLSAATKISATTIKDMSSSFQDLFVPMGYSDEQAKKMSKEFTKLSIDLMSFSSKIDDPLDAMRDLQAIMTGSHEVAKKYGVIINENKLNSRLMTMGVVGGYKAANEMEKGLARAKLMIEGTEAAQGNFVVSINTFKQSLYALKQSFISLKETIGEPFLKGLSLLFRGFGSLLDIIKTYLAENPNIVKSVAAFASIGLALGTSLTALGGALSLLSGLLSPLGILLGSIVYLFYDAIKGSESFQTAWTTLMSSTTESTQWIRDMWTKMSDYGTKFFDFIKSYIDYIAPIIIGKFGDITTSVFDVIQEAIRTTITPIIEVLNKVKGASENVSIAGGMVSVLGQSAGTFNPFTKRFWEKSLREELESGMYDETLDRLGQNLEAEPISVEEIMAGFDKASDKMKTKLESLKSGFGGEKPDMTWLDEFAKKIVPTAEKMGEMFKYDPNAFNLDKIRTKIDTKTMGAFGSEGMLSQIFPSKDIHMKQLDELKKQTEALKDISNTQMKRTAVYA